MKTYGVWWLSQPETAIIILKSTKEFFSSALKTTASDKHREEPNSEGSRKDVSYGRGVLGSAATTAVGSVQLSAAPAVLLFLCLLSPLAAS